MLVAAPMDWLRFYLWEAGKVHSSWMVVLLALPILTAYGIVYHGGHFRIVDLRHCTVLVPSVIGSAATCCW